ncbi:MAG: hypothetical protein S4CHLAM6_09970 [Chlamydiae bacterium]|nr:hypothetical protein [Chlamydiota bacterium]
MSSINVNQLNNLYYQTTFDQPEKVSSVFDVESEFKTLKKLVTEIYHKVITGPEDDLKGRLLIEEGILANNFERAEQLLKENVINLNKSYPWKGDKRSNFPIECAIDLLDGDNDIPAEDVIKFIELFVKYGAKLSSKFSTYEFRSNTAVSSAIETYSKNKRRKIFDYLITKKDLFKGVDLSQDFRELHYGFNSYKGANGEDVVSAVEVANFLFEMGATIPEDVSDEIFSWIFSYPCAQLYHNEMIEVFKKFGYELSYLQSGYKDQCDLYKERWSWKFVGTQKV